MIRRTSVLTAATAIAALAAGFGTVPASGQARTPSSGALFATVDGRSVVAQDGATGAGDPNGFGAFSAIRSGGRLCYGLTVRGIDQPLAVNVMRGTAADGSIAARLKAPARGAAGTRSACVSTPASVLQAIFTDPASYSLAVATDDYRDAAIAGRLQRAAAAPAAPRAAADARPPIRDCGDVSMNIAAVTAQGTTCAKARAIAKAVAASPACEGKQSCRARSYTCLLGEAGSELTLVRCENATQTRFARFELGS